MFCPYCGTKLSNEARFCQNCGKKINLTNYEETSSSSIEPSSRKAIVLYLESITALEFTREKLKRNLDNTINNLSSLENTRYHRYFQISSGWPFWIRMRWYCDKLQIQMYSPGGYNPHAPKSKARWKHDVWVDPYYGSDDFLRNQGYERGFYWMNVDENSDLYKFDKKRGPIGEFFIGTIPSIYWHRHYTREECGTALCYNGPYFGVPHKVMFDRFLVVSKEMNDKKNEIILNDDREIEQLQKVKSALETDLKEVDDLLINFYNLNIIPEQFRNIYAAYFLYTYMNSSQESLSSAFLHFDLNEIKKKLDTIISQQEQIIINQEIQIAQNKKLIAQNSQIIKGLLSIDSSLDSSLKSVNNSISQMNNKLDISNYYLKMINFYKDVDFWDNLQGGRWNKEVFV